jgi:hypothetical protein
VSSSIQACFLPFHVSRELIVRGLGSNAPPLLGFSLLSVCWSRQEPTTAKPFSSTSDLILAIHPREV